MASVEKRPNGKWRARWRETPGGPQKAKHFDRKVDADRFLATVQADLLRGTYVDPRLGRMPFRDFIPVWRAAQVHRPTTQAQVGTYLNNHILPEFGDRPMASITPSQVQAWVSSKSASLSAGYVICIFRYLSSVFRMAVADRLISVSPCSGVKLPKNRTEEVEPLTPEQVTAIGHTMDDRYRAAVFVGAGLGLRWAECFGLTVDRLDFDARTVRVDRQVARIGGDEHGLCPPKTNASYRTIPLPSSVGDHLTAHLAARGTVPGDSFVFPGPLGGPMRQASWRYVWRKAVVAAELPVSTRFHDLRHFYASALIASGASIKVVQSRLGHESAAVTLNTYGHLFPEDEDRTRSAIDALLASRSGLLRAV